MGTRQIKTETTRTITTCDRCDREVTHGALNRCWVCNRQCGYCCSSLQLIHDSNDTDRLLDLWFHVCKDCMEVGADRNLQSQSSVIVGTSYLDIMRDEATRVDKRLQALLAGWRKHAREAMAKKAQET